MKDIPLWITQLEPEELAFVRRFVLASGSLKEVASAYHVSYPTVRSRLNNVIEKIQNSEENREDPYEKLIKRLAMEGKVDFEAATLLIREHRAQKEESVC